MKNQNSARWRARAYRNGRIHSTRLQKTFCTLVSNSRDTATIFRSPFALRPRGKSKELLLLLCCYRRSKEEVLRSLKRGDSESWR